MEAYADELGLDLEGIGSWTLKRKELERGAEPDECYSLGPVREVPDLVIEVIWTSGGLDTLEIYRQLGVREIWIWRKGEIEVHVLHGDRCERAPGASCCRRWIWPWSARFSTRRASPRPCGSCAPGYGKAADQCSPCRWRGPAAARERNGHATCPDGALSLGGQQPRTD